jgi:hypothetical protein
MPKRIRTRSMLGTQVKYKNSGHVSRDVIIEPIQDITDAIISYTTAVITNNLITNQNNNIDLIKLPSSNILNNINISETIIQENINIYNNKFEEIFTIPTIPEHEIENIYENFIDPYNNIGPYKLPGFPEFQRLIILIDSEIENIGAKPDYKLKLFRGILDALIRGRSMYFYDLQLEGEVCNLRKKLCELEGLVQKYSTELALCQGNESGFAMAGSVGIRLKKPKNLIYAQALLNINMAWYIYLYNTKKIEYDKYQGVIEFIKEKGKKLAYDELIVILDEKYKDIEDDMFDDNCNSSSNDQSSNSSDCNDNNSQSNDSNSQCISRTDSFCSNNDDLIYSDNNNVPGLVVHGILTIVQPEKFGKLSYQGTDQLINRKNKTNKTNKTNKQNHKKTCKTSSI